MSATRSAIGTIRLFGHDDESTFGLAAMLDAEKIPYQRVDALTQHGTGLLIVTAPDLAPSEIAALRHSKCLVINGGPRFANAAFGAVNATSSQRACTISLDASLWPATTVQLAQSFHKAALRIPLAPVCTGTQITRGHCLAAFAETGAPAVLQANELIWSLVDIGAAFTNLLTEHYLPQRKQHRSISPLRRWARSTLEGAYYAAPDGVRRWGQTLSYAQLERQLQRLGEAASEYPIDATGWLLIELLKSLIKRAAGTLVRLERWPAPYRSAATLTHDIEPRRYAYTTGLDRLLNQVTALGHPATLGLVAGPADRYLDDARLPRLRDHAVICHGLEHRGEEVSGRAQVAERIASARTRLEHRLHRRINGYRSPRLDRSDDLVWALDHQGFGFDSSFPDVDRENVRHFGGGVRINLPFRPPVRDNGQGLRPSRCLELPLTAPDCIQPLFAGDTADALRATIATKAAFVRETGGLYVALVHGGVFGAPDATTREAHLRVVHAQLSHSDTWLAGLAEIKTWWCAREAVQISIVDGAIQLCNNAERPIAGLRLVMEQENETHSVAVPLLASAAALTIAVPTATLPGSMAADGLGHHATSMTAEVN